jgi:hypothetical protein
VLNPVKMGIIVPAKKIAEIVVVMVKLGRKVELNPVKMGIIVPAKGGGVGIWGIWFLIDNWITILKLLKILCLRMVDQTVANLKKNIVLDAT